MPKRKRDMYERSTWKRFDLFIIIPDEPIEFWSDDEEDLNYK